MKPRHKTCKEILADVANLRLVSKSYGSATLQYTAGTALCSWWKASSHRDCLMCWLMWQVVLTSPHKDWHWQCGAGIQGELPIPYQDEPWVISFLSCMPDFLCKDPGVQAGRELQHGTVTPWSEQTLDQEPWDTRVRNANREIEKIGLILAETETFAIMCALRSLERLNKK